ncbi:NAD(P)-binding domain-containing protein [Streptomyces sp. Ag109_O5-1]|uniref:NADPH-dependent F420 reductase n=1 Tax=Streptomyces sp. Ag109_O5-1 TaxID=1938851 RepID=UPI00288B4359|nr:NAD(P)-binding domain-containing protein [Streptomyces sp. Ag109_O5-1]
MPRSVRAGSRRVGGSPLKPLNSSTSRTDSAVPLTLGLIGSGAIGTSLARPAVAAGLDVVLSNSRGPETLSELVDTLGSHARAATPAAAARAGDLVVVSVPPTAPGLLPVDALNDKIVLDTGNCHPQRDGRPAELDADEITSSGLLQRHLPRSTVVKAFNSTGSEHRFRPALRSCPARRVTRPQCPAHRRRQHEGQGGGRPPAGRPRIRRGGHRHARGQPAERTERPRLRRALPRGGARRTGARGTVAVVSAGPRHRRRRGAGP